MKIMSVKMITAGINICKAYFLYTIHPAFLRQNYTKIPIYSGKPIVCTEKEM